MEKIKVVFSPTEEKPYIVIWKPRGLASAPLCQDDRDNALYQAGQLFPEVFRVSGRKNIEYGLLHRLDTATDGLLVIATNQETYDFLQNEQKEGRFIKYYSAICEINSNNGSSEKGFPPCHNDLSNIKAGDKYSFSSFFRGFGKGSTEVRPVTEESGRAALKKLGKQKVYNTEVIIKEISEDKKKCRVECKIVAGYRHQVRCHLAWGGLPIVNDKVYNFDFAEKLRENDFDKKNAENMRFSATKLEFYCPRGDLNSYEIAFTWT